MLGQETIIASVAAHPVIPPDHYPDSKQIADLAHYYVSKGKLTVEMDRDKGNNTPNHFY